MTPPRFRLQGWDAVGMTRSGYSPEGSGGNGIAGARSVSSENTLGRGALQWPNSEPLGSKDVGIRFDCEARNGLTRLDDGVMVRPGVLELMGQVSDGDGVDGALGAVEVKVKGGRGGAGDEP